MKLSIAIAENASEMAPIVLRGDLVESIKKAAQIGYDAVELHIRDPKEVDVNEIKDVCEQYNIEVSTIGTGSGYGMDKLSLSSPDEGIRQKAIQRIIDHIHFAKHFNAGVIIGLIRGQVKETKSYQAFETKLIMSLKECLAAAEKENIVLVLEAINRFESDVLCDLERTAAFVRKINSSHLKLHIDTFHMNIEERSMVNSIKNVKDVLGHVHLADSNRWYPGHGHYNFKETIEVLKEVSYSNILAMECMMFPEQNEAAEKAYAYIKKLL